MAYHRVGLPCHAFTPQPAGYPLTDNCHTPHLISSSTAVTWRSADLVRQTSNQLILYHPPSHALQVQPHAPALAGPSRPIQRQRAPLLLPFRPSPPVGACPYCAQPLPPSAAAATAPGSDAPAPYADDVSGRTPYFRILEQAHEGSRPPSPRLRATTPSPAPYASEATERGRGSGEDAQELPSKGYYERFFREEMRLGMGAEGSVFLATHIIGGNVLGRSFVA